MLEAQWGASWMEGRDSSDTCSCCTAGTWALRCGSFRRRGSWSGPSLWYSGRIWWGMAYPPPRYDKWRCCFALLRGEMVLKTHHCCISSELDVLFGVWTALGGIVVSDVNRSELWCCFVTEEDECSRLPGDDCIKCWIKFCTTFLHSWLYLSKCNMVKWRVENMGSLYWLWWCVNWKESSERVGDSSWLVPHSPSCCLVWVSWGGAKMIYWSMFKALGFH